MGRVVGGARDVAGRRGMGPDRASATPRSTLDCLRGFNGQGLRPRAQSARAHCLIYRDPDKKKKENRRSTEEVRGIKSPVSIPIS